MYISLQRMYIEQLKYLSTWVLYVFQHKVHKGKMH